MFVFSFFFFLFVVFFRWRNKCSRRWRRRCPRPSRKSFRWKSRSRSHSTWWSTFPSPWWSLFQLRFQFTKRWCTATRAINAFEIALLIVLRVNRRCARRIVQIILFLRIYITLSFHVPHPILHNYAFRNYLFRKFRVVVNYHRLYFIVVRLLYVNTIK